MAMQGLLVYVFVEEILHCGPTLAGLLFPARRLPAYRRARAELSRDQQVR